MVDMLKKAISFLFLFSFCAVLWGIAVPANSYAQNQQEKTIRIAVPVSRYELNEEADTGYIAFTMEYLHEVSQYTGWQYEMVEVPGTYEESLQKAFDLLQDGMVDLVAPVRYDPQMADTFYFSQSSYCTASVVLQIPNAVYTESNFEDNVTVAALVESGMQQAADLFSKRMGLLLPIYSATV